MTKTPLQEAFDLVSALSSVSKKHTIDTLSENLAKKLFVPTNKFFSHLIDKFHECMVDRWFNYETDSNIIYKIINDYNVDIPPKLCSLMLLSNSYTWQKNIEHLLNVCVRKNKILLLDIIMKEVSANKRFVNHGYNYELINILDNPKYFQLFIVFGTNSIGVTIDCMFKNNFKNGIIKLIDTVRVNDTHISYCVRNGNVEALTLLNSKGYNFTNLHLRLACECGDTNIIKNILDQKISPDDVCMKNVCIHSNESDKLRQNIELLLAYGYIVTKDDLLKITDNGIKIDEKFIPKQFFDDQTFMKKLTTTCNNNVIFAYGIKPTIDSLVCLIRKQGTAPEIKKFIKTHGIQPDITCLREVCKHIAYKPVLRLLIETYKIELDYECLVNRLDAYSGNQTKYIAEKAKDILLNKKKDNQI